MRDAALRVVVRLPVPRPAQPETALHHALARPARRAPLLLEARAAREVGVRALQLTPEADGGVAGAHLACCEVQLGGAEHVGQLRVRVHPFEGAVGNRSLGLALRLVERGHDLLAAAAAAAAARPVQSRRQRERSGEAASVK